MNEWKNIKGFEGYYKYNPSTGQILSVGGRIGCHRKNHILKEYLDTNGYPHVILQINGKKYYFKVHKLIAMNELPNPNNLPTIDHINGIKTDNRVENLRWCTLKENINNPITKINLKGKRNSPSTEFKKGMIPWIKGKHHSEESKQKNRNAHLGKISTKRKTIVQLNLNGDVVKEFPCCKIAANEMGFKSAESIRQACKENWRTSGGFKWMYKEDYENKMLEELTS